MYNAHSETIAAVPGKDLLTANDSIDLELMALAARLGSDPAQVRQRAAALLVRAPQSRSLALLLAAACLELGDAAAAVTTLEPWAAREPQSAVLRLELGRAYRAAGRMDDALTAMRQTVALRGGLAEGWRELAGLRFESGDEAGGDAAYLRYSRLLGNPAELTGALAAVAEGRFDAAERILQQRLAASPRDSAAWRLRGEVAMRRQKHADAERHFLQCLGLAPGDSAARYGLACSLHELNRSEEVLPLLERLLTGEPEEARYLELKAKALRQTMREDEALALLTQALAWHPDSASLLVLYGHMLREVGCAAEAIEVYRRGTALSPGAGVAWWCLANTKTYRFAEAELAGMRELLDSKRLQGADRVHLEFALGKALEDGGDFAQSFRHYSSGNALHRATFSYSPSAAEQATDRMCGIFTAEFLERRRGWGSDRNDPIFIVGLPRSGSTLIEQVLASHPLVEGTHELLALPAMATDLLSRQGAGGAAASDPPASATAAEIQVYAARYLRATARYRRLKTPRFTDKQLGNFRYLPLIQLMFPKASIIDVRRHPIAAGFACYKQHFTHAVPFCYDLGEVARYYRDYVRLMDHIDAVLPGRVYRVYYERLVADPEGEVRRLLGYCGLPFAPDCLRFHTNRRIVRTISSEQVRRPIYPDSVGQWRHYEPWLGLLREALGDLAAAYPGTAG